MKSNLFLKRKRIRNNRLSYLPFSTFICAIFKWPNFYYNCFKYHTLFKTQYRLSRHFVQTKCLKNIPRYKNILLRKKKKDNNSKILQEPNPSSLIIIQDDFNNLKKEMQSFYGSTSNSINKINDNIKLDEILNADKNLISSKKQFKDEMEKDNILGEGNFVIVFCVNYWKTKSFIALKYIKKFSTQIIKEVSFLKDLEDINGVPKLLQIEDIRNKNFIAESLCGPSIEKLHFFCGNTFNQLSVIKIGISLIKILKDIHKKEYNTQRFKTFKDILWYIFPK